MDRITNRILEHLVSEINKKTGNAQAPYTRKDGKLIANIGNYHLDWAYGGVKLVQMMGEGGGITVISDYGFGTKRECYNYMRAFIRGLDTGTYNATVKTIGAMS